MTPRRTIPDECLTSRQDPLIVLGEKQSRLLIENPERSTVEIVVVDGCAICEGKRCDYLVIPQDPLSVECFVELKGTKIQVAFDQIERTIKLLSRAPGKHKKQCIVVTRRVPRLAAKIEKAKRYFLKQYEAELILKNSPCRHRIK